jgi:hypothetical protein
MIKLIDTKINKINKTTHISLQFEDTYLSKDQYKFIKERLKMFESYINSEYSLEYQTQYNQSSELLFIGVTIIIPDHLMPKDPEKSTETIMDPIIIFQKFYEAQNTIFKKKHRNI